MLCCCITSNSTEKRLIETNSKTAAQKEMKCSLLFALALRAQSGQGFVGPTGGLVLSNCVSAAAAAHNGIVRRGVASTTFRAAAASDGDSDVSGGGGGGSRQLVCDAAGYSCYASDCRCCGPRVYCRGCATDNLYVEKSLGCA